MSQPRFSELDDWLAWLEQLHPRTIDLGRERIRTVAQRLDLLRPRARVITVAGTNGKGSCVATLERFLGHLGRRCGAYTSPHIDRYNERVKIDGVPASDADLCRAFARIDRAREDISLTYFEFGTLAALLLFAEQALDYWLLEVGLGGRLDAVNIIDPELAIITAIDLDHQEWLGDNREAIGGEKAGILRRGITFVCADPEPPRSVLTQAEQLATAYYQLGREFAIAEADGNALTLTGPDATQLNYRDLPPLALPPNSVAAALQALLLCGETIDRGALEAVLPGLTLAGRFQKRTLAPGCELICDVAHNPAACRYLAERLRAELGAHGPAEIHLIVGMMADKAIGPSLSPLVALVDRWYLVSFPEFARAATVETLDATLRAAGVAGEHIARSGSVAAALRELGERAKTSTRASLKIVAMGSFITVAAANRALAEGHFNVG